MRYVHLPNIPMPSSVLGFGCSALLGRSGRAESIRALTAAYESGINFFDTARSYGYGESESLLGDFLKGRRDRVIISTKFGILPVRSSWWKNALKPLVRGALEIAPGGRKLLRNQVNAQFEEGMFSAEVLRNSLEESLRRLKTDYVDFLFAHSAPPSILDNHELMMELDKAVRSGKVRNAGVSTTPAMALEILENKPAFLTALQFPCNIFDGCLQTDEQLKTDGVTFVANHPFGGVLRVAECRQILSKLFQAENIPADLRSKLGNVDDQLLADLILNTILLQSKVDVVIPAMMKPKHLQSNIAAVQSSRFTEAELLWIRSQWRGNFASSSPNLNRGVLQNSGR